MKKRTKKIVVGAVIVLVVLGLIVAGVWFYKHLGKTYTAYSIKNELEMSGNTDASYMIGENGVIRYTRDGVSSYDSTGKELWNVSYEMSDPIGDVCGSYAAVADEGSVNLYVLDGTGKFYQITSEHGIEYVSVAGNGVVAVWMSDETKDYITVYKNDGTKIVDMMTTTEEDGIPVAIDLSEDGTKLVTSYASFEDTKLINQLTFYNFGEVGSNYVDRLVGLKVYEDRLVADIEFAGNDTVVAFSDKGVNIFAMEETEEEAASVDITETIRSVSVSDEYIGVVTTNANGIDTAHIYDLKGSKKDTKELTENYENFVISDSDMIFYGGTSLYISRIGGNDKAVISLSMDIDGIYAVDNKRTYVIVGEKSLQTIVLEQGSEEVSK